MINTDNLKNLINEQYGIYSNPQSSERQKDDARNKIITELFNYLLKRYAKKPAVQDYVGIAVMEACEKALNKYSLEKAKISGFFGYFYTILKQELNGHLEDESIKSKSGNRLTAHAIRIYKKVQKEYEDIIKLKPWVSKEMIANFISLKIGLKEETVLRYLNYENERVVSINAELGEDEESTLESYLGDDEELSSDTIAAFREEFFGMLLAFQKEWENDKILKSDAPAETKERRAKLNAYYSKEFTCEILSNIDSICASLNLEDIPDFMEYSIIDKDILGQFKDPSSDFEIPDKKVIAAELGLKTITNEYKRFRENVMKKYPELKAFL